MDEKAKTAPCAQPRGMKFLEQPSLSPHFLLGLGISKIGRVPVIPAWWGYDGKAYLALQPLGSKLPFPLFQAYSWMGFLLEFIWSEHLRAWDAKQPLSPGTG